MKMPITIFQKLLRVKNMGSRDERCSNASRESRVTLHRVKFLQGDVYHVLGGSNAAAEDAAYAAAEDIRRGLLKSE